MFTRKSLVSLYPAAVMAALAITVMVVVATLVEAVAGMEIVL